MPLIRIILTLLAVLLTSACSRKPDVILITIDTLRADHLGVYGYGRDTSPTLDALAAAGAAVPRCYAQSATTGASHASLFTGLEPPLAGVISNQEQFPADSISIMDRLREEGYDTAGFVSGYVVGRRFGIQEKFDHFDDTFTTAEANRPAQGERPAKETLREVARWLDGRRSDRPLFLWIHLIDPHGPYDPPEGGDRFLGATGFDPGPLLEASTDNFPFGKIPAYQVLGDERRAGFYVARYDAEIRYTDDALGEFFQTLRARGSWDRSILVVTSDHGETLAEPGHRRLFSHSIVAYEETARVPLIIREEAGRTDLHQLAARPGIVRLVDLAPTLLARLGAEPLPSTTGRNLLAERNADHAVTLGAYGSESHRAIGTQHSVLIGPWRYVLNAPGGEEELYDHRRDPAETRNLAAAHPSEVEAGRGRLRQTLARKKDRFEPILDDEEGMRTLRSLGYIR